MKLPVQAPAVVRGSFSWPTRRPARGSTEPAIAPAQLPPGAAIACADPMPTACVCDNGIATCCGPMATGCYVDTDTGACTCYGVPP